VQFDKISQISLKPNLLEKCWLAAFIVTCIRDLDIGFGFFQFRVLSVIPCLRSFAVDVYFESCITKPYYVGPPPFYCSAVITTS